jgi:hypothetical protein
VPAAVAPPAEVALDKPLAFADETMAYAISFRTVHVARVQVAVGKPGWFEGRPAIIVKARGATDGVLSLIGTINWQLETTIDLENGSPLHMKEEATATVAGETNEVHRDHAPSEHTVLSAATVLRGWRSMPNQQAKLDLRIDAADIDVEIHEVAHEFLEAQAKPAVRYAGTARSSSPFQLWISDDIARVPLALHAATEWGSIDMELVDYDAPRDQ